MGEVIIRGAKVRNEAVEIVRRGGTFEEASKATGFGVDYVRQLCTKAGVHKPRFSKDKDRTDKAIEMIKEGKTAKEITDALGYSGENAIYGICKRHNVKISAIKNRDDKICDMREKGYTIAYIAERFNVSDDVIYAVLKKRGLIKHWHVKYTKEFWRVCEKCGKSFFTDIGNKKFCSIECQKSNSWSRNDHLRRTRVHASVFDKDITLERVYEKYNGICYICGQKCNYEDYVIKNGKKCACGNYPSIEHVIPVSKGGTHTWGNVRLACISCNAKKGVNVVG